MPHGPGRTIEPITDTVGVMILFNWQSGSWWSNSWEEDTMHIRSARPFLSTKFLGKDPGQVHYKKDLVLLMMAFQGEGMEEVYAAIEAGCTDIGLHPRRADQNTGSGHIMRDVLTLIHDAEFIVCDLTNARPNVYYELGYAHGVGNHHLNILLTAREGTTLHFDIAQLRVREYGSTTELRTMVATTLTDMMRHTRKIDVTAPDDQP
jgi:hypothetical protein